MNLADDAARHAARDPRHPAILFEGETIDYGELDRRVATAAGGLKALGVGRGDRVAIVLPNCPEFIILYLASLRLGAIAVTLDGNQGPRSLGHMLRDSAPGVILTTNDFARRVPWDRLDPGYSHISVGSPSSGTDPLGDLAIAGASVDETLDVPRDAPGAILYTSGTTGFPKGVVLSHGNIAFVAAAKKRYCGFASSDRAVLFVPMFHVFGQNAILNAALHAGSTVVLHRRFDPDAVIASVQDHEATMFFAVPTVYSLLLERCSPEVLRSVRFWFSAAAMLPADIAYRWRERFGRPIHEGYGLTETAPFVCFNHETEHRLGSVGTPIDDVEIRVVDPDTGRDVPDGEAGEILVCGPNVMIGYWNRPEETREAIVDGWFRSGDLGRIDPGGYLVLIDRIKDMIDVAGFKVWPAEVETVLAEHPAVRLAAVFRRPDSHTGERVSAQVILTEGAHVSPSELLAWCRDQLASYKVPVELKIVTELPMGPSRKVLRRVLSDQSGTEIAGSATP